jgi:hypothetical protein
MKFGRRFATISQDAWWATDNINYKELKKTLKGVEGSESEGTFLANLLREVQKVRASERRPQPAAPAPPRRAPRPPLAPAVAVRVGNPRILGRVKLSSRARAQRLREEGADLPPLPRPAPCARKGEQLLRRD